jgi:hypothetical protein
MPYGTSGTSGTSGYGATSGTTGHRTDFERSLDPDKYAGREQFPGYPGTGTQHHHHHTGKENYPKENYPGGSQYSGTGKTGYPGGAGYEGGKEVKTTTTVVQTNERLP